MNLIKEKLIEYLMDNSSLTEEVDYLPDAERYKIYKEQVSQLTDREALEQFHASLEPSEIMDFIEELVSEVSNEKQRADEAVDLYETALSETKKSEEKLNSLLNTAIDYQEMMKEAIARHNLGVAGQWEEFLAHAQAFIDEDL